MSSISQAIENRAWSIFTSSAIVCLIMLFVHYTGFGVMFWLAFSLSTILAIGSLVVFVKARLSRPMVYENEGEDED